VVNTVVFSSTEDVSKFESARDTAAISGSHLIDRKVLLPGVSVLESVAQVTYRLVREDHDP